MAGQMEGTAASPLVCPDCATPNAPRAKFCGECGRKLAAPLAAGLPASGFHAPEFHAPEFQAFGAERRQLTVMFCDLVGSTTLSTQIDPEDLGEIIRGYRNLVREEVARLGGFIARLFGDGILVYFGFPMAREDDAARAVRAALNILRGMAMLNAGREGAPSGPLEVHIGIHTGLVLVEGDAQTRQIDKSSIIGETPNLAARIEAVAPPGTILVSAATHGLTAKLFDYQLWGDVELKGFPRKTRIYQPLAEWDWRSAPHGAGGETPLVGREPERALLEACWRDAAGGHGRAVTVAGEAGIGKTRLARWLARRVEEEGGICLQLFCDADSADTAFRPVIEAVRRYLGLARRSGPRGLRLIGRIISRAGLQADRFVPVLAELLSLVPEESAQLRRLMPKARRQRLLTLLVEWLTHAAYRRPVLLIVDNVHWADASTHEWLDELTRAVGGMRLMMIATYRPNFTAGWFGAPQVTGLTLDRLSGPELERMLDVLGEASHLDRETRQQALQKCDGVPLFLEELVKMLAGQPEGESQDQDVPSALRDMLAARLDRLGASREVARAASVIGRQFSYDLLRGVLDGKPSDLEHGLARLVQADIIRPIGPPAGPGPNTAFAFRHALLRDAAYSSLLRAERRLYHRKLVGAYRAHYAKLVETEPEIIARHASAAGQPAEALDSWWAAGSRARSRSAYREALSHFRRGLADAENVAEEQVIRFCVAIATTAIAAEGFAAPEVERMSSRARALLSASTDSALTIAVMGGLNSYYQVRGPLRLAQDMCERQIDLASATGKAEEMMGPRRRMGWCLFCRGEILAGRELLRVALEQYRQGEAPVAGRMTETDAGVVGLVNLGWVECFVGNMEAGERLCAESRERAVMLGRLPMDMAYALSMSAAAAQLRGETALAATQAGEALEIATANGLPYWEAWAGILRSWAISRHDPARGLFGIRDGIAAYRATGARLFVPYSLALAADACLLLAEEDPAAVGSGLALVQEGLEEATEIDAHFFDAELLRLKGELLLRGGEAAAGREALRLAVDLANSQQAPGLLHRAERSLAGSGAFV